MNRKDFIKTLIVGSGAATSFVKESKVIEAGNCIKSVIEANPSPSFVNGGIANGSTLWDWTKTNSGMIGWNSVLTGKIDFERS